MTILNQPIPDERTPGRYVTIGYVGRKSERLYSWSTRSAAERNAAAALADGYSNRYGARFTRVVVEDQVNGSICWDGTAPVKRRGNQD